MDFGKVAGFLRMLADAKAGQAVAAGKEQLAALGLVSSDDVAGATNVPSGTLVSCLDSKGESVASILVGKQHMRTSGDGAAYGGYPDGRYARVDGDASLVAGTLLTTCPSKTATGSTARQHQQFAVPGKARQHDSDN